MPATNPFFSTGNGESRLLVTLTVAASIIVSACSTAPLTPYSEDTPPLVLLPVTAGRYRR